MKKTTEPNRIRPDVTGRFGASIPVEVQQALDEMARGEGRTRSQMIARLVTEYAKAAGVVIKDRWETRTPRGRPVKHEACPAKSCRKNANAS